MLQIKSLSKPILASLYELKDSYTHSIFNNVVNIQWENKLISIQNNRVPKGSLSMVVEGEINFKDNSPNLRGKVNITGDVVTIGRMKFLISEPEIWDPELKYLPRIFFINKEAVIKAINNIILINGKNSGTMDATFKSLEQNIPVNYTKESNLFYNILIKSMNSLKNKELNVAANEISDLIGIGIGLTPSGDDFIVGFISVLHSVMQEKTCIKEFYFLLRDEVVKRVSKTTDVSRAYLLEAVEGRFSESFHNLYAALEKENFGDIYKSSLSMMAVGHSSGTDGLCGILWGLYQLDYLN